MPMCSPPGADRISFHYNLALFGAFFVVTHLDQIAVVAVLAATTATAGAQVYFRDTGSYTFVGSTVNHTIAGTTLPLPFFIVPLTGTVAAGETVNISFVVSGAQVTAFTSNQGSVLLLTDPTDSANTSNVSIGPGLANGNQSLSVTASASSGFAKFGTIAWTPVDTVTISSICVFGPGGCTSSVSADDTTAALRALAASLKTPLVLGKASAVNALSYHCDRFDANNLCLSAIGRRLSGNGTDYSENAAAVMLGYRLSPHWRLGAFVDQASSSATANLRVSSDRPLMGVSATWNARADGEGMEVRSAITFRQQSLGITRSVVGTSEGGAGSTEMSSKLASLTALYHYALSDHWMVAPYAGIRYYQGKVNGYTEVASDSVTSPLTYAELTENTVSASLGMRVSGRFGKTTGTASVGLDRDLRSELDALSATGVEGVGAVAPDGYQRHVNRATATLGIARDFGERQQVALTALYRQEAFRSTATTALFAQYSVGF